MIRLHKHVQRGTFHTNYCEDFVIAQPIGTTRWLLAVMDGCTMGTESHFAATLKGKILRKLAKKRYYLSFMQQTESLLPELLDQVIKALFLELRFLQQQLHLDKYELLSTLVMGILDVGTRQFSARVIGDGLLQVNGHFQDATFLTGENYWTKKLYHLSTVYGLEPTDDLGLVRVVLP
ncbi:MAG: protein phosphatase 2C domain-containing protein [Bacteroidota bacterium]